MYYNQHPEVEVKSTDMVAPHRHKKEKRERRRKGPEIVRIRKEETKHKNQKMRCKKEG